MSSIGFVSLHRGLWDSPDFRDEPFSQREAFIWLIAQAAFKPREVRVGSHTAKLERGQCAFSLRFLADKWQWSVKRVRTFLKRGKERAQIGHTAGTHFTIITICNYDKFQTAPEKGARERAQRGHNGGTKRNKVIMDTPLSKDNGDAEAPEDIAKVVFDSGVRTMTAAGVEERTARQMIGLWRKKHSDDKVLDAILAARNASEPLSFITATLNRSADLISVGGVRIREAV